MLQSLLMSGPFNSFYKDNARLHNLQHTTQHKQVSWYSLAPSLHSQNNSGTTHAVELHMGIIHSNAKGLHFSAVNYYYVSYKNIPYTSTDLRF